ncbi:hypothetical protein CLIB1423_19S02388 [[Candida] railenensis]|uniref:Uncharacterized protein n=1 Tax=[Candida] railenensis TaxID=45579 RepID=A0A9P0QSR9_9ASCO|nr:hypothetical protein CLIB1423_19S02388 [[Candida] railenensis]
MEIKFGYTLDNSDEGEGVLHQTLLKIWKLTNHSEVSMLNSGQSVTSRGKLNEEVDEVRRLNYRSWRLLQIGHSDRRQTLQGKFSPILNFKEVESEGMILRDSAPSAKQFLKNRDNSLFSDLSTRSTLFSHQSGTRTDQELDLDGGDNVKGSNRIEIESDSESDISDISEVDEDEELDDEDDYFDSESEAESVGEDTSPAAGAHKDKHNGGGKVEAGTPRSPQEREVPLPRSKTSFVRGFSPSNVSIAFNQSQPVQAPASAAGPSGTQSSTNLFKRNAADSQNIFFIANSPSPTENSTSRGTSNDKNDNNNNNNNNAKTSSTVATRSVSVSGSGSGSGVGSMPGVNERQRSDSLFQSPPKEKQLTKSISHRSCSSTDISENENDNDSAWQSVSSEDEEEDVILNRKEELVFSKRSIELPIRANTDPTMVTHSESISITHNNNNNHNSGKSHSDMGGSHNGGSGSGGSYQPRSLLSGLFLNRMAEKPSLKRSSTTDVMRAASSSNGNSLIVGSDKNKQSILFDNHVNSVGAGSDGGNGGKKPNSLLDFKRHSYQNTAMNAESLPLAKKDSIVGISDFNVVTQTPTIKSLSVRSNSTVDIIAEETGSPESLLTPNYSNGVGSDVETLSSSLNKYSVRRSTSSLSINGLLSKSSMNLSGFFRNGNGNSGAKLNGENEGMLPSRRSFVMNGIFKKKEESPKGAAKTTKSEQYQPAKGGEDKIEKVESQPLKSPSTSVNTDNTAAATPKYTPKQNKIRSNLSTELSESLKDSIIIDYKLGKIPLPEKVIESGKLEKFILEDEGDDYHSKGW